MKFVRIFGAEDSEEGLWSIQLDSETQSEFEKFFDLVNDVEFLHRFFDRNKADLYGGYFGNITMDMAVSKTLSEAEEMEDVLYDLSDRGFKGGDDALKHVFKPLNNFEYAINTHQKSKGRVKKGWFRLYAIRLAANCYLVTGGAIKLT